MLADDLFVVAVHVFHVNRVQFVFAGYDRRFGEILAAAEFFENARSFVFSFEFFQSAFDVFALFDRHDNHVVKCFFNE